jgi:hypothetical protein
LQVNAVHRATSTVSATASNRPVHHFDLIHDPLDAFNSAHGFLRQLCVEKAV